MREAFDRATLDFYAAEAPVYAASGPDGTSRHLAGFLARLTPGARILELGCGGGRDAAAMIAAGFDVDATDGAPALADEAALNQPTAETLLAAYAVSGAWDVLAVQEYEGTVMTASACRGWRTTRRAA